MKKKVMELKKEKLRQRKRPKKIKKNMLSRNKKRSLFITKKRLAKKKETVKETPKKQLLKVLKKNQKWRKLKDRDLPFRKAQQKKLEAAFKAGQKKPSPSELSGARIFYESLRKQNPKSNMAEAYLVKYGLLPKKEAERIVKKSMKLKEKNKWKKKAQWKSLKQRLRNPKINRTRKRKAQIQSNVRKSNAKRRSARKYRVRRSSESFDRITESLVSFVIDWYPTCC